MGEGRSGNAALFYKYAKQIINNPKMRNPFMLSLEGMLKEHPERQEEVSAWLNQQNKSVSPKTISPEMAQLVGELKANIQVLLKEGKASEAKMLLEELKKYV